MQGRPCVAYSVIDILYAVELVSHILKLVDPDSCK